ncbi:hypothetical protein P7C70_g1567, partial [Phenoliferia sp. Uapishka_3]
MSKSDTDLKISQEFTFQTLSARPFTSVLPPFNSGSWELEPPSHQGGSYRYKTPDVELRCHDAPGSIMKNCRNFTITINGQKKWCAGHVWDDKSDIIHVTFGQMEVGALGEDMEAAIYRATLEWSTNSSRVDAGVAAAASHEVRIKELEEQLKSIKETVDTLEESRKNSN